MLSRLLDHLGSELTLRDLFNYPTIAELAELADQHAGPAKAEQPITRVADAPDYPVSHAQRRLWVLDQLEGSAAYQMVTALRVGGSIDVAGLRHALATVVNRHESLRTCFVERDGELRQRVVDVPVPPFTHVDLSSEADPRAAAKARAFRDAQQAFDLAQAPLLRVQLLRLGEQEHVLLFNLHHIVSDGWSMDVLVHELMLSYRQFVDGTDETLPPLALQHRDYVA